MYISVCISVYVLTYMHVCVSQKKKVKPRKSNESVAAVQQPVTESWERDNFVNVYECIYVCMRVCMYISVCISMC